MELFCGCNSSWEFQDDVVDWYQQVNFTPGYDKKVPDGLCYICDYWFWYDVNYENHMFDLKRMNEM